jgi:uncharacterized surface protein with fasciclin (FAS1) repeats
MKFTDKQTNVWIGFGVLVIIVILAAWWVSQSAAPVAGGGTAATTTASTTTPPVVVGEAPKPKVIDSTVSGVVASLADGTKFASLYSSTGVAALVKGPGPFTVFVPTNEAYASAASAITQMSMPQKKLLAEYHVLADRELDPGAILSGTVQTMSRDYLNIGVNTQGKPQVGNARIVATYQATNGVVYLVSGVLFPPAQ